MPDRHGTNPDAREGTADSRDQGTKHLDIVAGGVQHDNTEVHCHQVLLKDEVTLCGQQHVKMVCSDSEQCAVACL